VWLNQFKIALIQEESEKLATLLESMPQFETLEEANEASHLLIQAYELIDTLQEETKVSMQQLKKHIDYVASTEEEPKAKLDIKQ